MKAPAILVPTPTLCLSVFARAAEPGLPQKHLALLENHCFDCHDAEMQKGKVNLEALSFDITTVEQAVLWRKVLNAMNSGEMPPEKKPQPANDEKADFLDDLAQEIVTAAKNKQYTLGEFIHALVQSEPFQTK